MAEGAEGAEGAEALVLDGGTRMRLRKSRPPNISEEQVETFFATLAETCNVVRSARAAGFSAGWAYRKRRRDAAFRAGWARAVREGYAILELVLLERAMKGTPKPLIRRDGSERIIREYPTALAVALLRRHADTADEADPDQDDEAMAETRERILAKLEQMRARSEEAVREGLSTGSVLPQDEPEKIETKAAADRIATIRWGLLRRRGAER